MKTTEERLIALEVISEQLLSVIESEILTKTRENILIEQSNHPISECIKELTFNRPAAAQKFIDDLVHQAKMFETKYKVIKTEGSPINLRYNSKNIINQETYDNINSLLEHCNNDNDYNIVFNSLKNVKLCKQ